MPSTTKFIVVAVCVLAAATAVYLILRTPTVPTLPTVADVPALLRELPVSNAAGTAAVPAAWQEKRVLGRYDNMARAGDRIDGRWANNIKDACIAAVPVTSIPDENAWEQPIALMQCFDGATVFVINLKD